jgi:hypothetical protein
MQFLIGVVRSADDVIGLFSILLQICRITDRVVRRLFGNVFQVIKVRRLFSLILVLAYHFLSVGSEESAGIGRTSFVISLFRRIRFRLVKRFGVAEIACGLPLKSFSRGNLHLETIMEMI